MPLYEYKCPECEEKFDLMRPLADRDRPAICPSCGHEGARREFARISTSVRGGTTTAPAPSCGGGFG